MRMWMIDPSFICRQHLLGEHVELHMLVGAIRHGRSIAGHVRGGFVEPLAINARHDRIVAEMKSRGYKHNSPLTVVSVHALKAVGLTDGEISTRVDAMSSFGELMNRCEECRKRDYLQCSSPLVKVPQYCSIGYWVWEIRV